MYVRRSPTTAVGRSTCLLRLIVNGAAASRRSSTASLTAPSNRLVAVTATLSVMPGTPAMLGIATRTSRRAVPAYPRATGPASGESAPSRVPLAFASRYNVTGHPRDEATATVKESAPLPTFAMLWANTTVVPAAPVLARGGSTSTPATWPTSKETVSEVATPSLALAFS